MPKLPYESIAGRWRVLRNRGWRVREVACVGAPRTLLCAEFGEPALPVVALSAGVHGDEPAGVEALLALAEDDALDPRFAYRVWPCLNPTGYDAGTRKNAAGSDINRTFARAGGSPEAAAVIIANRDLRFALAIDLHEDDEGAGFYCYDYGGAPGERALAAATASGHPADPRGVLRPDPESEARELGGLSLMLRLIRHAAPRGITLETASARPFDERVAAHMAAVRAVLTEPSLIPRVL
jgi:hypothetical protein